MDNLSRLFIGQKYKYARNRCVKIIINKPVTSLAIYSVIYQALRL